MQERTRKIMFFKERNQKMIYQRVKNCQIVITLGVVKIKNVDIIFIGWESTSKRREKFMRK